MAGSPVYLRDLEKEKATEAFLGKGLDKLKERAEKEDKNIIVGHYLDRPILE